MSFLKLISPFLSLLLGWRRTLALDDDMTLDLDWSCFYLQVYVLPLLSFVLEKPTIRHGGGVHHYHLHPAFCNREKSKDKFGYPQNPSFA